MNNTDKVDYLFHTDKSNAENLPVLQTNQLRNDMKNFNLSLKQRKKVKRKNRGTGRDKQN